MKRIFVSMVLFLLMLVVAQQAWAYDPYGYGYQELDRAKNYMDRGDYRYAMSLFNDISRRSTYDRSIRKEAAYYIGFCLVKTNDPWGAIRAYESFLDRFDSSSDSFLIPDAHYVLGRTYEEIYNNDRARYYYRRCIDRFPYNEFAGKSRDRLRIIGHGYGYPHYSVSASMDNAPVESKTPVSKKSDKKALDRKNDPYLSFSSDKARINRVNTFISAVEKMENADDAIRRLQKEDYSLEIVKQAMDRYSKKQNFNNLHQESH